MDETLPDMAPAPEQPPPSPRLPFRLPADYYGNPERTPVLPRAVPYGCGAVALLFLIVFFIIGAMLSGDGGGRFMAAIFGYMQTEVDGQFTKDVTPAQRAEFDAQFKVLMERVRSGRANLQRLQPFLEKMRDASMDERVTPDEAKALTDSLREMNGK